LAVDGAVGSKVLVASSVNVGVGSDICSDEQAENKTTKTIHATIKIIDIFHTHSQPLFLLSKDPCQIISCKPPKVV
jgi:hypothetical protein